MERDSERLVLLLLKWRIVYAMHESVTIARDCERQRMAKIQTRLAYTHRRSLHHHIPVAPSSRPSTSNSYR
jgi:hypothetical protein